MIRALSAAVVVALVGTRPRSRRRPSPESATACISAGTPPRAGLPLASPLRGAPRSLVLCVTSSGRAPLAIRTFAGTACRGEWKLGGFAVRYGGGDYTTFGRCVAYKTDRAAARLAQAQSTHSKACAAQLQSAPRVGSQSPRFGFGLWVCRRPLLIAAGALLAAVAAVAAGAAPPGSVMVVCHNLAQTAATDPIFTSHHAGDRLVLGRVWLPERLLRWPPKANAGDERFLKHGIVVTAGPARDRRRAVRFTRRLPADVRRLDGVGPRDRAVPAQPTAPPPRGRAATCCGSRRACRSP